MNAESSSESPPTSRMIVGSSVKQPRARLASETMLRSGREAGRRTQFRWPLASLFLFGLAVAGSQQGTTSLPKPSQRQQIFHQMSPSQQLASSNDLGDQADSLAKMGQNEPTAAGHQPRQLLTLRAVPVSARGALSFVSSGQQPASPSSLLSPKCPSATSGGPSSASGAAASRKLANMIALNQPTSVTEAIAVEGATVNINLAISGHSHGQPQQATHSNHLAALGLRLHWQRDGQPINELNLARARFSSVQLASETDAETISHLLGNETELEPAASKVARFQWLSTMEAAEQTAEHSQQAAASGFIQFPFINARQLERLEKGPAHQVGLMSGQARQSVANILKRAGQDKASTPRLLKSDTFLAEGQSIDWRSLGGFLRSQQRSGQEQQVAPNDCKPDQQQARMEQLMVIQLEIGQLRAQDRGLYQLYVCQQISAADQAVGLHKPLKNTNDCLQSQLLAAIALQVVEDVPRLESWFEPQLLSQGDRLSIKCEATGFTLPQISWFLDGQLLSEHHAGKSLSPLHRSFGVMSVDEASAGLDLDQQQRQFGGARSIVSSGQSFRVGDYVSQDNHVHSFVNSSSVRATDGGFYKCQANNGLHLVEHEARIDVQGPANIGRSLGFNMSALVGAAHFQLQCPYSGHPTGPVEWYFRQTESRHTGSGAPDQHDYLDVYSQHQGRTLRRKRGPLERESERDGLIRPGRASEESARGAGNDLEPEEADKYLVGGASARLSPPRASADEQQPDVPDPDRDEWLAQASLMTLPPSPDDYPEPLPDYPIPVLDDGYQSASLLDSAELPAEDYAEVEEAGPQSRGFARSRRATAPDAPADKWAKLPQSRRHQVHSNGTLVVHDIQQEDQGLYKCHVLPAGGAPQLDQSASTWSDELHLAVLVAPVISPFGSSESLREGMRNFLTCSVIEGDSPVRLSWLKDGRPIEEHIARASSSAAPSQSGQQPSGGFATDGNGSQRRIKVESSNEYTSTVSFGQVDFRDNGNYTCVATNKAASVNYTARMVVNVPPKWTRSPKDVESVAGQNIVIDCQAEAHPNPRIWWEIGVAADQQHHAAGKLEEAHANRLAAGPQSSLRPSGGGPSAPHQQHPAGLEQAPNHYRTIISNSRTYILENASLVIRDVGKQDQGFYLCQAANNFGLLSALIKLTVNVGASFANKYHTKYVRLNERVELDCDPDGQAPVTVTWFARQHSPLASIENQLNQSYASASLAARREKFGQLGAELETNNQSSSHYNRAYQHHSSAGAFPIDGEQAAADERRSSAEAGPLNGRRRLYSGTIATDLPASQSAALGGAANNQQQSLSSPPPPSDSLSADRAGHASSLIGGGQLAAGGAQPAGKLIEIDSSMSFEILKSRQVLAGSGQASQAANGDHLTRAGGEIVRLHIKQARRSNSGEYICHAANQFGADEKLIKLLVQEPPDPIREISALQIDSRSVSIAWPAPFNGNSPITSYTVEWAQLEEAPKEQALGDNGGSGEPKQVAPAGWSQLVVQQTAATLAQLQPMTSYEIRVIAHNQFGHSRASNGPILAAGAPISGVQSLVVTTSEEAPAAPPRDIKAVALSSSSVQVTWMAPSSEGTPESPSAADKTESEYRAGGGSNSMQSKHKRRKVQPSPIKGYYLGYKAANSNDSFIFKTVATLNRAPAGEQATSLTPTSSNPQPFKQDVPPESSSRVTVQIGDLRRATKYLIIVQAFNSAGPGPQSDSIEVATLLNDPPPAPVLRVGAVTPTSLELLWSFRQAQELMPEEMGAFGPLDSALKQLASRASSEGNKPGAVIDGYKLFYRLAGLTGEGGPATSDWHERRLAQETHSVEPSSVQMGAASQSGGHQADLTIVEQLRPPTQLGSSWSRYHSSNASISQRTFRYLLDQLTCGNFYQIYMIAYNSYGSGPPSQAIRAKTRGSSPLAPRRQQDFIQSNSTLVKLNLSAWQDGGCSLTNFEIKYRQLQNRSAAISMLNSQLGAASANQEPAPRRTDANTGDWLLLSNNINPDQRSIELRDLQPETWYGIWVTAESVAGKTNVQYAFMTLDKFGQLPSEAIEPLPSMGGNNFPALFKSGPGAGSIKSILYSLSNGPNGLVMQPLVLSASLCLIIFATCSLFLIRRYNTISKDNQSLDMAPARTGAALTSSEGSANKLYNKPSQYLYAKPNDETRSISPADPHYSTRVSPCKTGATVITNSSSSTNGSSGAFLLGAGSSICDSAAYGRPDMIPDDQLAVQQQTQQVPMDHLSQFMGSSTMNYRNSRHIQSDKCCGQDMKFSTLNRDLLNQQHQQHIAADNNLANLQSSCFRTLPHSNPRPVSTFLSPSATHNQQLQNQLPCQMHGASAEEAEFQQRQIYSKLRLLQHYNAAAAAASTCNAMCQQQQQADHEAVMALNQLYGQTAQPALEEQQLQQNGLSNNGVQQHPAGLANEQDDYALPFPPKWV